MPDVPAVIPTCEVTGLFTQFGVDGTDAGRIPDLRYLNGKIEFVPNVSRIKVTNSVPPMTMFPDTITAYVENGILVDELKVPGVLVPATGNLISTYTVKFNLNGIRPFEILTPIPGPSMDLVEALELPSVNLAPSIAEWRAVSAEARAYRDQARESAESINVNQFVTSVNGQEPDSEGNVELDFDGGTGGGPGTPGASAYEVAVENGFVGSELQWLESLEGDSGISAYQSWLNAGNSGTEAAFLASLKGTPGSPGAPSTVAGPSAFQVWLALPGNAGKQEADFIEAIKGPVGPASTVPGPASTVAGPAGPVTQWQVTATHLQQRPAGTATWNNVVPLDTIRGPSALLYGFKPVVYFDGEEWPSKAELYPGYTGDILWDSLGYVNAPEPPEQGDGDDWDRMLDA